MFNIGDIVYCESRQKSGPIYKKGKAKVLNVIDENSYRVYYLELKTSSLLLVNTLGYTDVIRHFTKLDEALA